MFTLFTSIMGELKGWFNRAFLMAVWLPVCVFASAATVVYLAGAGELASGAAAWAQWQTDEKVILVAEFVIVITLVAFGLEYVQVSITRLFEGYWTELPVLRSFGQWKRRRYELEINSLDRRLEYLSQEIPELEAAGRPAGSLRAELNRLSARRLGSVPPGYEAELMPTRLGNLYKSAELYPYTRYGIDSVVLWPRLREVLPEQFVGRLQEVKTAVDFLLLFSFLSILFSLLAVPYLWARGAQVWLVLACVSGLPLGWLSYRTALSPAQAYSELLKVAFDLHRKALLKALGLSAPITLSQEQALWRDISDFIFRGIPPSQDWQFDAPVAKKED
jgi:hypothetical protein